MRNPTDAVLIAYSDPSALLRIVLREPGALDDLRTYDGLVASELIAVESARAIDRLRIQGTLTMDEAADWHSAAEGDSLDSYINNVSPSIPFDR